MDKQFDFEVGIIGAGIIGSFTFNFCALNGIKTCLFEAGEDVSLGATKANSAIIHAGYDPIPSSKMAYYNVLGAKMYPAIAKRLGEKIISCGSLVVAQKDGLDGIRALYERGKTNGVSGLEILNKEQVHALEPNLNENIEWALYAKTAKIISPYNFAISLCEEAIINGGELKLNFPVDEIKQDGEGWRVNSNGQSFTCRFLVNCAGFNCDRINKLAGAEKVDITYTIGEYILLDKSEGGVVSRPIFPLPTALGKGILVAPTASGNIICGPTARPIKDYNVAVSQEGLAEIKTKTSAMVNGLNFKKAIKLYAGVRTKCGSDFVIGKSARVNNFYYTAGIASPGLASAPAIAEDLVQNLIKNGVKTHKINIKLRKPYSNTQKMATAELNALIAKNPNYGKLVCRCEKITQGEIEEVLAGPIKPLTIEGIKRRLRVTMGRCQGSFCLPTLIDLMAKAYKVSPDKIIARGETPLVVSPIKTGGIYVNIANKSTKEAK